jgi:hypothetical protein
MRLIEPMDDLPDFPKSMLQSVCDFALFRQHLALPQCKDEQHERCGNSDRPSSFLWRKRASASPPSGEWNDDDYDVLAEGVVVGRIFKARRAVGEPWMWTLAFGHHEDHTPTHGYAATREAAMAAFAKAAGVTI